MLEPIHAAAAEALATGAGLAETLQRNGFDMEQALAIAEAAFQSARRGSAYRTAAAGAALAVSLASEPRGRNSGLWMRRTVTALQARPVYTRALGLAAHLAALRRTGDLGTVELLEPLREVVMPAAWLKVDSEVADAAPELERLSEMVHTRDDRRFRSFIRRRCGGAAQWPALDAAMADRKYLDAILAGRFVEWALLYSSVIRVPAADEVSRIMALEVVRYGSARDGFRFVAERAAEQRLKYPVNNDDLVAIATDLALAGTRIERLEALLAKLNMAERLPRHKAIQLRTVRLFIAAARDPHGPEAAMHIRWLNRMLSGRPMFAVLLLRGCEKLVAAGVPVASMRSTMTSIWCGMQGSHPPRKGDCRHPGARYLYLQLRHERNRSHQ